MGKTMDSKRWWWKTICVLAMAVALLAPGQVRADAGPKPSMNFQFKWDTATKAAIEEATLFRCADATCANPEPMPEMGPQGVFCEEDKCKSYAYGYADFHILAVRFANGVTLESNVFPKRFYFAYYNVTVRDGDLVVAERRGMDNPLQMLFAGITSLALAFFAAIVFIVLALAAKNKEITLRTAPVAFIVVYLLSVLAIAVGVTTYLPFALTLVLESAVALGYAVARKQRAIPLITIVLLANLITHPILTVGMITRGESWYMLSLGVAEVFVWLAETVILSLVLRDKLKFKQALLLSLILNLVSFGVGLIFPL